MLLSDRHSLAVFILTWSCGLGQDSSVFQGLSFRCVPQAPAVLPKGVKDLQFPKCSACCLFRLPRVSQVYWPYLLMNKKRYAGLLWTKVEKYDKMDTKGLETVRRDNCLLVRKVMTTTFALALNNNRVSPVCLLRG